MRPPGASTMVQPNCRRSSRTALPGSSGVSVGARSCGESCSGVAPRTIPTGRRSRAYKAAAAAPVRADTTTNATATSRRRGRHATSSHPTAHSGSATSASSGQVTGGAQSRAALAPVVEKLRSGISLAIAPEGTRSATPTLGPFKKGAFHIAVQAEVPIVPVVVRNAGEIMWRATLVARPGTVDVVVLPPVPTNGLGADDVEDLVDRVRQQFVETLDNWPT